MHSIPEAKYLLKVKNLFVNFAYTQAVIGASFTIHKGQTIALVGESGSGKSVTAHAILKLLPNNAKVSGIIEYPSVSSNLLAEPINKIRQIRGNKIAMIFQEPMTSLNPLHNIERQISEVLNLHQGLQGKSAQTKCLELLETVEITNAKNRLKALPHELSGGQRQRVMIAMALANNPQLLIADEPTTALDVTVTQKILTLLKKIQNELNMAILLISHDLNLVKRVSDFVCVMNDGKIIEQNSTKQIFIDPKHFYTKQLLNSEAKGSPANNPPQNKLLKVNNLNVQFGKQNTNKFTQLFTKPKPIIYAVNNVSFSLKTGQTLGIVGESGSGKSTLALAILRLITSSGEINFNGININQLNQTQMRKIRKQLQVVFQDPYGSLSPRLTVTQIIGEGLNIHQIGNSSQREQIIDEILLEVGINPITKFRYPHEFSGGQRQRIAIARALILKPKLIILDEPTSALDRTVQTQIIDLLRNLQQKYKITFIFISHDLAVIKALSHDLLVLHKGKVIEYGNAKNIFANPKHPNTKELINAAFINS